MLQPLLKKIYTKDKYIYMTQRFQQELKMRCMSLENNK